MMQVTHAVDRGVSSARPQPVAVQVLPEGDPQGRVAAYHMVVKRSYRFGDDGALRPAPARPLELSDRWMDGGDPSTSSPAAVCELVPPKPRCDVVVMGHCHPPERQSTDCVCAVRVGAIEHRARVVGDRTAWLPAGARRARYSAPRPFTAMPLDWGRAWGGRDPFDPGWRALESNPVGRGYWVAAPPEAAPAAWTARAADVVLPGGLRTPDRHGLLPNVLPESGWPGPDDLLRPAETDGPDPRPMGFGWRAQHWAADGEPPPSAAATGIADARGPNRAPAGLQVPHPGGGDDIELTHLRAGAPRLVLTVPFDFPRVYWNAGFGRVAIHMALDTVLIAPDAGRLDLVWRGTLPMPADPRPTTVMPRLLEVDGTLRRWAVPFEAPIPPETLYGPAPAGGAR